MIKNLKIIMPGIVTPSGNETKRWEMLGLFWKFKREKRMYWSLLLLCKADDPKFRCSPKKKRRVEFYSYRSRLLDDDNLAQGFKMLRDALERMGIIWRDSPKYLDAEYHQEIDRDNLRTEIVVRDI